MKEAEKVLLIVALVFLAHVLFSIFRRYYFLKIQKEMLNPGDDRFERHICSTFTSLVLPPYTVRLLQLQRAELKGDDALEDRVLRDLLNRGLNTQQAAEIGIRGFNFYLLRNDREMCEVFKKRIDELPEHAEMKKYVDRSFNIILLKKDQYLEELLAEREQLSDEMRSGCEFLISRVYENRRDQENAAKYAALCRLHMKQLNMQLLSDEA